MLHFIYWKDEMGEIFGKKKKQENTQNMLLMVMGILGRGTTKK